MVGIIVMVVVALFFIVALCFLVIALSASNPQGRRVDVRVLSCEQKAFMNEGDIKVYEVKVDFYGSNGEVLVRILRSAKPYTPGDMIRCRYMEKTGLLLEDMAPEAKKKLRNSVLLFLIVFLVFAGIAAVAFWGRYTGKEPSNDSMRLFGYFIGILFVAVGVIGVRQKMQTKQKQQDMISLPGIQVDYETVRENQDDRYVSTFRPVYEYEWGGEKKRICSPIRASGRKYRTIGRRVHILVNPQTGEVVCQEDEKTRGDLYVLFGVIGLATLALMLALSFGIF